MAAPKQAPHPQQRQKYQRQSCGQVQVQKKRQAIQAQIAQSQERSGQRKQGWRERRNTFELHPNAKPHAHCNRHRRLQPARQLRQMALVQRVVNRSGQCIHAAVVGGQRCRVNVMQARCGGADDHHLARQRRHAAQRLAAFSCGKHIGKINLRVTIGLFTPCHQLIF